MENLRMSRPGYRGRRHPVAFRAARERAGRARFFARLSVLLATSLVLGSCSLWKGDVEHPGNPRLVEYGQPVPKGGGFYKIGKPYQVAGKWYYPKEDPNYANTGTASWYGLDFHGRRTANGEIYDMDALSAAHPTLPLPTYAKVKNLENGREVVVRVNDRGPFARGREIDVSKRAADLLAFSQKGTAKVRVTYLGRAPLSGDDGWATNVQFAENKPKPVDTRPVRLASAAPDPLLAPPPVRTAAVPSRPAASYASAGAATAIIQAGSFRDADNADRLRYELASLGPVEVTPVDVGGVTYYQVRVGPIPAGENARNALNQVWAAGASGARLVMVQ